jgi:hypothetical protein
MVTKEIGKDLGEHVFLVALRFQRPFSTYLSVHNGSEQNDFADGGDRFFALGRDALALVSMESHG